MTDAANGRRIRVVAGILIDAGGRILVSRRPEGKHGAGQWEFPGGKIGRDEDSEAALRRELAEELGIRIIETRPFMSLRHDYPERRVALEFRLVTAWDGEVTALESQQLAWTEAPALAEYDMLEADAPVLRALGANPQQMLS